MAVADSRVAERSPALYWRLCKQIVDLSVAEKIFGLLAFLVAFTGFLSMTSFQAVRLQNEYRSLLTTSASAAVNIGRVDALIYAVVMESRGVYMSTEPAKLKQFSDKVHQRNRELAGVVAEWKATVREDDFDLFRAFEARIDQFIDFRRELARRGVEIGPAAAREWGDNDGNRNLRSALNADLESLAGVYAKRAREVTDLGDLNRYASWYLAALGVAIVSLAGLIVLVTIRFITVPLSEITKATDRVAAGHIETEIPFADRPDEIGHLACALRNAIRRNFELEEIELGTAKQRDAAIGERDKFNGKYLETKWQLQAALNNMAQGLVMIDSKCKILMANERFRTMYQLPREIIGPDTMLRDILRFRAEKGLFLGDIDKFMAAILDRIATGKPSVTEFPIADGRIFRVSEQPMAGGGWVSTHEDFTEQRRAERILARTERFLVTIIENVTQAIVAKEAHDLRYIFVNKAAEKLFGIPRAEIIGKSARDLFPAETAEMIEQQDRLLLAGNEDFDVAVRTVSTPRNGQRAVSARRLKIAGDNESQIFLSIIEDLTDKADAT
jgi:PAS domain S-box-containing protein